MCLGQTLFSLAGGNAFQGRLFAGEAARSALGAAFARVNPLAALGHE